MRWKSGRRSSNIDDRRGQSARSTAGMAAAPALLRFLPALMRSKTGRRVLIIAVLVVFGARLMGVDVLSMFSGGTASMNSASAPLSAEQQELADFTAVVLADTEDTWHKIFQQQAKTYREPTLVLFSGRVNSACGTASSAVGPFYCPGDQKLYIDLSFFHDLNTRYGAPGDFAQAYVIAHEVGHHVQTLLGISRQLQLAGQGKSQAEINALSVRQELQADCFAGLWGHAANTERQLLDPGDLEEALRAATAIGDDRLQRQAGREVVPDSFTHGSSAQRVRWFRTGFESGQLASCDTFSSSSL
ncbi:neutral zinc metallopeptidase [Parahaliea sp. F7430]|uniref:Neutral zinc metallopeptidase n=1 Tax=Sediminihaliea albiluteola TaxID=2758564 RepID=A0A7W2YIU5_9GAMM|nr:neutral zinc metallopeptidase [Sediminihaliea albiluteola]MBA6412475.1 neutral zinc metallopeptidase [Sediminihaliea albiluteola]